ncbi:squalene synthase HpnC [Rhodococcus sp. HNM0569]|uniref:squalene synthase HpnC n=1 Tax=Rhodococcus sp. HNM0569 TaxID=2716340 RepID=UPI00146E76F1|nr:squalene synthase HpnC [Rhodococcus sp. HNM0569]NLU83461.1 squalene synthase HpnC [Rhodococcus sp. HNM0569]
MPFSGFESPRVQNTTPGRGDGREPSTATLDQLAHAENFPVALRVLPRSVRADLRAVYAVARTIDELGDSAPGDRTAALADFRTDLHRVWAGRTPRRAVLRSLVPTVRAHELEATPFDRLIDANLADQHTHTYDTFDELIGYCTLSADPIGRLVLAVFDQDTPPARALSDTVCRALQLLEHWQDVAEDRRAGRVYLPREDMVRFGVTGTDLDAAHANDAVRRLMRFEIDRASELLESGAPLVGMLRGWARVAVAGYVAGGRAAAHGLRRTGGDVLGIEAITRKRDVFRSACALSLRPPSAKEAVA